MPSALDNPGRELGAYIDHLAELAEQARLDTRDVADAEIGAHALAALLAGSMAILRADRLSYDDPKNADLIS